MNQGAQITRSRVEEICKETGQSQNEIARDLECSPGNFSRVLSGERLPGRGLAVRILSKLGTPMKAWDLPLASEPIEAA